MQAKCPKCGSGAFRMLPESEKATEVECLRCGHLGPFVRTLVGEEGIETQPRMHPASLRDNASE